MIWVIVSLSRVTVLPVPPLVVLPLSPRLLCPPGLRMTSALSTTQRPIKKDAYNIQSNKIQIFCTCFHVEDETFIRVEWYISSWWITTNILTCWQLHSYKGQRLDGKSSTQNMFHFRVCQKLFMSTADSRDRTITLALALALAASKHIYNGAQKTKPHLLL